MGSCLPAPSFKHLVIFLTFLKLGENTIHVCLVAATHSPSEDDSMEKSIVGTRKA